MSQDPDRNTPRMEPWAYVTVSCFIPLAIAALIPARFRWIPLVATVVLLVAGVVMLVRQEGSMLPREGGGPAD